MDLYVVSKTSQEKSSTGIIERVDEVVYGNFTAEERADFDEQGRRIARGLTPDLSVPLEEAVSQKEAS